MNKQTGLDETGVPEVPEVLATAWTGSPEWPLSVLKFNAVLCHKTDNKSDSLSLLPSFVSFGNIFFQTYVFHDRNAQKGIVSSPIIYSY